jgi:hypothetical protein
MEITDDGWDDAGPAEKPVLAPIYSPEANTSQNLSCSSFPHEFCYLCSYMDRPLPGATEMTMRDHVEALVAEEKELQTITHAVQKIYNSTCRSHCKDAKGNVGPEWSTASITRHLLHTHEAVFNRYTESILQHLVCKQASRIVDVDGHVADDERKALLNTIDHLVKWRGRKEPPKRRRIATVKDDD